MATDSLQPCEDWDLRPEETPGDLIGGKYRLEQKLGQGGMGSVWLARNVDLDAPVAIKLIHPDAPLSEAAVRLKREARVEARLRHPAIVHVFDYGETEYSHPFLVMEALDGTSFASVLHEHRTVSPLAAARMLLPIAEGLAAAHDAGIVHRDVKPENIFLARAGRTIQPKLIDFGIAKIDEWSPDPRITIRGAIMGSPAYMAPEQARGAPGVDGRADVWALCIVLYEAVKGAPPFDGATYNAILRRILEDAVPPLEGSAPEVAELWAIIERGLRKDPEERTQSMHELVRDLSDFVMAHGFTCGVNGEPLGRSTVNEGATSAVTRRSAAVDETPRPESDTPTEHEVYVAPGSRTRPRGGFLGRTSVRSVLAVAASAGLLWGAVTHRDLEGAPSSNATLIPNHSANPIPRPTAEPLRFAVSAVAAPSPAPADRIAVREPIPNVREEGPSRARVPRRSRAAARPARAPTPPPVIPLPPDVPSDLKVPY
ncbi:MAG TPA: serine/threonine-protein kinase [Polyangiaceae bacterium]|nr:serine/threonine-protein kinase [Polyangiaceae bacterium]